MVSELKKGPQAPEPKIMIGDYKLEVVKKFKHVGVLETRNARVDVRMAHRRVRMTLA
jgi:hypothetical protein